MPQGQLRVWLYVPPTDLRKSFDGLSALVRTKLQEDPLSGQLFVFLNRRATQAPAATQTPPAVATPNSPT